MGFLFFSYCYFYVYNDTYFIIEMDLFLTLAILHNLPYRNFQILVEEFQHAQGQTIWEFSGNFLGILYEFFWGILGESFGEFLLK